MGIFNSPLLEESHLFTQTVLLFWEKNNYIFYRQFHTFWIQNIHIFHGHLQSSLIRIITLFSQRQLQSFWIRIIMPFHFFFSFLSKHDYIFTQTVVHFLDQINAFLPLKGNTLQNDPLHSPKSHMIPVLWFNLMDPAYDSKLGTKQDPGYATRDKCQP